MGLVGGSILHSSESHGQEPKWSPQPFQAFPSTAAVAEKTDNTERASSDFAPVQRWRKTDRISRLARAQSDASSTIASNWNEPKPSSSGRSVANDDPGVKSLDDHQSRDKAEVAAPVRFLRPPEGAPIQKTRHHASSESLRSSVVAARWSPDDNPPDDHLPNDRSLEQPPLPQVPVRLKNPARERGASLDQDAKPAPADPPVVPNPFPRPNTADSKDWIDDSPPSPPAGMQRKPIDCGELRDFVTNLDIHRVRVDSSPDFVEGYPTKDRALKKTKENFVAEAPVRSWHSQSGEELARGKLLDLLFENVLIEKEDGSKATYLLRKLSDADQVYVADAWGIPFTCSLGDQDVAQRMFADSILTWKASGLCHKPLYFEDVQLERYGHEWGPVVQPALSTVRFFGDLAVLPYKMGIHPPRECQYPLGYYRPGDCAPWTHGPVPISLRGALSQAAFVTGTAWALP